MANVGLSKDRVREVMKSNGVTDNLIIEAIAEVIYENNLLLKKDIPNASFEKIINGVKARGGNI
ncbi:hypothetical protein [Halobacillus massiliensis]|uniref:hypothetical protein n=1 Tax=Halobacillus massiliensis TaxID=1926286 RepID=UPI0009E31769|nr:hypothetical protein [Halobacillus massiliensis]